MDCAPNVKDCPANEEPENIGVPAPAPNGNEGVADNTGDAENVKAGEEFAAPVLPNALAVVVICAPSPKVELVKGDEVACMLNGRGDGAAAGVAGKLGGADDVAVKIGVAEVGADDPNEKAGFKCAVVDEENGLAGDGEAGAPNVNNCPAGGVFDWLPNVKLADKDDAEGHDDCMANEKVGGVDDTTPAPNDSDDVDVAVDAAPKEKAAADEDIVEVSGSSVIGSVAIVSTSAGLSAPELSVARVPLFSASKKPSMAVALPGDARPGVEFSGSDAPIATGRTTATGAAANTADDEAVPADDTAAADDTNTGCVGAAASPVTAGGAPLATSATTSAGAVSAASDGRWDTVAGGDGDAPASGEAASDTGDETATAAAGNGVDAFGEVDTGDVNKATDEVATVDKVVAAETFNTGDPLSVTVGGKDKAGKGLMVGKGEIEFST